MLLHRMNVARFACLLIASSAAACAADPAVASPGLLERIATAPALEAAHRRVLAARARLEAAGRLPDPSVEGMGSRMVGPMDERSTMWEVTVRQPLPKKGERAADRDRASAAISMAEADYALMAGEMAADVAMALAEAEGARERMRLLSGQVERLDAVLRSVEARLAAGTGGGRIAERLTVQSRVAAMQLMIEEERRMEADAHAVVRGRLGLASDAALPAFAAPEPDDIRIEEAAALRLAAARSQEAGAMARMARASANPMTSVGVRFERTRTGMGDENTLGIAFMSDLPWRSRGYARAEARAAEADRNAAQADAGAARHQAAVARRRVDNALKNAEAAERLSTGTLARIRAEYDALLNAAGAASLSGTAMSGDSTVFMLVELLEKASDAELQRVRASVALRTARAELWRFIPAGRFPQPPATRLAASSPSLTSN